MGTSEAIDVICQHCKDGSVIPMRIKVQDDEQVYQIYKIKSYRNLSTEEMLLPNEVMVTSNTMRFDCRIDILGMEKKIVLHYNKSQVKWYAYY
ncbi:MAG: hypothetical protein ACI4F4_03360 [Lachnospiraceae bacterium]